MRGIVRTRVQPCMIGLLGSLAILLVAGPLTAGVNQWTKTGPPGADVRAIAVDPSDASSVVVGTYHGVFRSTDGGSTWSASSDGLGRLDVQALVMSPADSNVLFVAAYQDGLFRSVDGGATWAHFGAGLPAWLMSLAVSASDASVMYAGTRVDGLFKSVDGGATWSPVNNGIGTGYPIELTEVDPSNPQTAYAATVVTLYKTTDGGTSWVPLPGVLLPRVLRIDPSQTNTLYVGVDSPGGVRKSTDGGGSWTQLNNGLGNVTVYALSLDPTNSAVLYTGTNDGVLLKSSDAGASWTTVEDGRWPATVTFIAVAPSSPSTVLAGYAGPGLLRSHDGGGTWSEASSGLTDLTMDYVAVTPGDPPTVYGLHAGGVWKSADGGLSWSRANGDLPRLGGRGRGLVTDPTAPGVAYVIPTFLTVPSKLYKTTDGGSHWQLLDNGLPFGASHIAIDPGHPATLYASAFLAGVYKSVDGGASWTPSMGGMNLGDVVVDIAVSAADSQVVLAATEASLQSTVLYRSADGGANWVAETGLPVWWPSGRRVAADSADPELAYALGKDVDGTPYGPYRTTDGGASWAPAQSGIPATGALSVLADPVRPSALFAGTTDVGVYLSLDTGVSWLDLNLGATPPEVRDFAYDPVTNTLFAAAGDGIWSLTFVAPTIGGCPLPVGLEGVPYDATLSATGGVSPYTWSLVSGSPPSGITFNAAQASLTGSATEAGEFDLMVRATDSIGQETQQSCALIIAAPLELTGASLPGGRVGVAYSVQLELTGGVQPFSWTLTGGSLPGGVSLDPATGTLSGTPTEGGSFAFTVNVADGSGQNATGTFTLNVAAQGETIPAQTPWGLLVLVAAIAASGVIRLRS